MASGSYMTPIYSRSQSEVQGDLHKLFTISKEVFEFYSENCKIAGRSLWHIAFLSLIGTQTVPGSPQFEFRSTSRSPHRFALSLKGPHKGSLKNPVFRWRSFTTALENPIFFFSQALLLPLYPLFHTILHLIFLLGSLVLLSPLSVTAPLFSCSSAASVGLNSSPMGADV
ncbi:hypothetical protein TNCV_328121 [Trichonephila clavipes]|nr:hypothetical protein TNCV_328121 [Trichonephila clavipes]